MHIYNTPSTFQTISSILLPLIDITVRQKIVLYDKNVSPTIIQELFAIKN
jgi:hypothetical protein